MTERLFDVYAVKIEGVARRLLAEGMTERSADAIVRMAIARRGVEDEFYRVEPQQAATAEARK